jgi:hypothetical protein
MQRAPRAPRVLAVVLAALAVLASSAGARDLPLALLTLTSPVQRGRDARLTVRTAPDVQCLLLVQYRVGAGPADLAMPKRADRKGLVSWTWRVDPRTAPGTWPLIVHCTDEFKGSVEQRRLEIPLVVR